MKLTWCTDTHLDFLEGQDGSRAESGFIAPLSQVNCDGFFFTGDVSSAGFLLRHLRILDSRLRRPVYFVLGNHDFWGGDFEGVRRQVRSLCSASKNLVYLTDVGHVSLTPRTALVGHDGWYDALHGDPESSGVMMNDWVKISDFFVVSGIMPGIPPWAARPNLGAVVSLSRKAAFAAAEHIREHAAEAAQDHDVVLVATHVPPFLEAHNPEGKSHSDSAVPWYTSKLMGEAILDVAQAYPDVRFEVFCGHTHGGFDCQVAPNVSCHVGESQYGRPGVAGTLQIP